MLECHNDVDLKAVLWSRGCGFDFRSGRYQVVTEWVNWVPAHLAGVELGRVHLCLVAGNTVWSHMAGDAPLLCNGFFIKSYTQPLTRFYAGRYFIVGSDFWLVVCKLYSVYCAVYIETHTGDGCHGESSFCHVYHWNWQQQQVDNKCHQAYCSQQNGHQSLVSTKGLFPAAYCSPRNDWLFLTQIIISPLYVIQVICLSCPDALLKHRKLWRNGVHIL